MVILCVWGGSFRPSENGGIITACMRYGFALCQKRAGGHMSFCSVAYFLVLT